MTICCVPDGSVTEMWVCVCLVLLMQGSWITSLPIQEASSSPINATENTRAVRQLDFTECCPCPKNKISTDEELEALPSNAVEASVLPNGSKRDVSREDDGGEAGCACELRDADAAAAAAEDLTRKVSALRSALTRPSGSASEDPSILKPEVGLASSFLETLREATDEEYRDALERDAQRSQDRSRDAATEGNNNVVTIIVSPHDDQEDDALTKPSNVHNPRRVLSSLDRVARKNKPATSFIKEMLGLPSSRTLNDKTFLDNASDPSEVNEGVFKRQGGNNDYNNIVQNPTVKPSNEPASLDSSSSASSNVETFAPSNQARSNIEEDNKLLSLGRSSISDDFLKLKNAKDIIGEREIKLKVPYLKVPSLINKDTSTRSSGRKLPSLSELLEDIISPTIDNGRPNEEIEDPPQQHKEEAKKVDKINDINESDDDYNDNRKFKTRILDTLPSFSQTDDSNNIPSNSFSPNFPVQSLDPERDNSEGIPVHESDDYPNDPEGSQSMPNVMIVEPMSPVFTPEERSSNEMNSLETLTENSSEIHNNSQIKYDSNHVRISTPNSTSSESNRSAILERLDKLSKISTDLEKIKDLVEDISKGKLETNQPKSADSDTGASERHENISILPHKVLQAPQTLSTNLKKIGNKLRSNKKGMLGASSERIQSLSLPRLSDLTAKPFDVFNLMLPQDRIIQPSLIDPGKILPWDINNLRARAVPELPSVDEIRDRISDFIGRSGLGINALSDMDDDSNINHPIFALGKSRGNQQTELADLDVFRLRPLKVYPSTKSRSQQPIQGFNLEKFKAKVQVPTKSVKAVKLQSSFGKDGRIVGGRFSLQPPSDGFWEKVRNKKPPNTSNISKNQPIPTLDSLKSDLKTRTDNILESVKSNAPVLSSPLAGGIHSQNLLMPVQKTSSSLINEVRKRVDNVLGVTNAGQRDLNLKDSLIKRKTTIENRLQEIHSDLVEQMSGIEPLTSKNTHIGSRTAKPTVDHQIYKPQISSLLRKSPPESDRTRLDNPTKKRITRPKSNIELRNPNVNNAKSTQSIGKNVKPSVKRLKDAEFAPSDSIALNKKILKRVNHKDSSIDIISQPALRQNTKISRNNDNFEKKGSEINFNSAPPLLRSVLKRKNIYGSENADSSTIPSIPSFRNLKDRSRKQILNISPEIPTPQSVILKNSQPKHDVGSDEKFSNVAFEKFNEKIQSRLADIDARAKKILKSSKYAQFEEPQLGASENQERLSHLRSSHNTKSDEQSTIQDNIFKASSTASSNGPSWQKLTEKIQARLSEADAAVKKSLEHSNPREKSQLRGNSPNDMFKDGSETITKSLNSPRSSAASSGPSLQKLTEKIQSRLSEADATVKKTLENPNPTQRSKLKSDSPTDTNEGASEFEIKRLNLKTSKTPPALSDLSDNFKSKLSDANEALKQALQNTRFVKDSDKTTSEHSGARIKGDDSHGGPLAKLTEKIQGRLSETGTTFKNILHGSNDKQSSQSNVQEVSDNVDFKRQSQNSVRAKSFLGEKLSQRLQNTKLNQESDLEQRATETHDLRGDEEFIPKNAAPLDKLRDKLQSRFAETDKAFKNVLKGPGIVQTTHEDRSVEAIENYATEKFIPVKNNRPLLDKITERMKNRNVGGRNTFVSSETAEPRSSRDGSGDSHSSNIMKVSPVPLLERLSENHRLPKLSHSSQPILGAAPTNIGDMNQGASENIESTNSENSEKNGYVPLNTSPLAKLTQKIHSKIFREENPALNNVENEVMVQNTSDNLQAASRNSNKPMKQNVTYRCRMVCEEVSDKK